MTAPLFRLAAGALTGCGPGDVVRLDGPEGHHAARVLRVRVGDVILVADGSGAVGQGRVRRAHEGVVEAVLETLGAGADAPTPSGPRFVLIQALIKGGRAESAVEAATELGADEVVAWQAQRCVVVWRGDRAVHSLAKWAGAAAAATKQARRATAPVVSGPVDTAALLERIRTADLALVLHEDAADLLAKVVPPDDGEVIIVVGPEGGITSEERHLMGQAGGRQVRLGPHVLRSGTAGPAALAVLSALTRWR